MKLQKDNVIGILVLLPSLILVGVFVYGFIVDTFYVSISNWGSGAALALNPQIKVIGFVHYKNLFTDFLGSRFRQDLVNAIFYSLLLIVGALSIGVTLAIALDRNPKGRNVYRTIFLYPMALSFIVTGTIWRWLESPGGGINVIPTFFGGKAAQFLWLSSDTTVLQFNWQHIHQIVAVILAVGFAGFALRAFLRSRSHVIAHGSTRSERRKAIVLAAIAVALGLFAALSGGLAPKVLPSKEMHGFNLATIGIIIAVVWQYSGYTMALFIAGFGGISEQLHDSAKLDGANEYQYYAHIALPMLRSTVLTAVIILGHISLKMFALIFAMAGPDNSATGHPSLLMYLTTFRANNFARGAAVAVILFLLIAIFVVPYLVNSYRGERR